MTYTLTMRDDVDGSVCVVPADDAASEAGVLLCDPEVAVAVVDGVARRGGSWKAHPTLRVSDRPVAVAGCDVTATIVAAINGGAPVEAALDVPTVGARKLAAAA